MQVTNQKPAVLTPVYKAVIKGNFEPDKYLKETCAAPLFSPVIPNTPVSMQTSNGTAIDEDFITNQILACLGETVDPAAEAAAKEIFGQTLVYFDKNAGLSVSNLFSIQAAVQEKLPYPSPNCVYTPATDVIPASSEFLAGRCSYEKWFASLSFYARPETLGFYFVNEVAFDTFKQWLDGQIQTISSFLDAKTNQLFTDFQKLTLDGLTESIVIRNDDSDNNDEYSFARTLISYMMTYTNSISSAQYGVLPFSLGELFCPKTVVFVNIERHARATAKQVAEEWAYINNSISAKVKIMKNTGIQKLTSAVRNINKIKQRAAAASATTNARAKTQKAAAQKFRKTPPTSFDIARAISKVLKKMSVDARSENTYKSVKMTYARPNRRDPDDFSKQGKTVSIQYYPDIHVYLDTSGSISERNYEDSIKALIKFARKFNVNIYFNSFSSVLSQCVKLKTKDKSVKQIYNEFRKIPKVTGGTDYEQIWHYINKSSKRRRECSLIITDFEYHAPNRYVKHPKNLFYLPVSHTDWDNILYWVKSFCSSMINIDPMCRKKILIDP